MYLALRDKPGIAAKAAHPEWARKKNLNGVTHL